MKTVILCGGQGTRIRGVNENLPKPMLPVGNLPILWHIMKYYSSMGHKDFILCLGYKGHVIKEFFLNYEAHTRDFSIRLGAAHSVEYHTVHEESDWLVTLADTGADAMTGARVRKIKKYIGTDEHFMLTYGDGVGDIDINGVLHYHKKHGRILTVTGVRPPSRFGELATDVDGQVLEFNEKPQATGGRISGGFFVCSRKIFDYLPDREDLVFEQEPMRALVADEQMMMYEHEGFWQPMDTYRDFMFLNGLVVRGEAPWIKW